MTYDFMRLLLFFDLPMVTKKDVKIYNKFRKYLIANGYIMIQFSVYCKIFPNRESLVKHIDVLKKAVPTQGQIRIMMVTEKQYSKMEIIIGGKSYQETIVGSDSFVVL